MEHEGDPMIPKGCLYDCIRRDLFGWVPVLSPFAFGMLIHVAVLEDREPGLLMPGEADPVQYLLRALSVPAKDRRAGAARHVRSLFESGALALHEGQIRSVDRRGRAIVDGALCGVGHAPVDASSSVRGVTVERSSRHRGRPNSAESLDTHFAPTNQPTNQKNKPAAAAADVVDDPVARDPGGPAAAAAASNVRSLAERVNAARAAAAKMFESIPGSETPPPTPEEHMAATHVAAMAAAGRSEAPGGGTRFGRIEAMGVYARAWEAHTRTMFMKAGAAHEPFERWAACCEEQGRCEGVEPREVAERHVAWFFAQEWAAKCGFDASRLVVRFSADWARVKGSQLTPAAQHPLAPPQRKRGESDEEFRVREDRHIHQQVLRKARGDEYWDYRSGAIARSAS